MRLEAREGAFLVIADEPAIAGDIRCEDGGQPPLNAILGHSVVPIPRPLVKFMAELSECLCGLVFTTPIE
jgi:hypothetical protein